ncbi:MAG: DUF1599 domain-containing protein [Bacteroidetes bacterium]|nr:MAG: DUF1599 domain-containing protein [Bacteroidota bacterium]
MNPLTNQQYLQIIEFCKELFEQKNQDYGTSWRILRLPSVTDQIFIKAKRIRSIQEKKTQKIEDSMASEFVGIINYCAIALIQCQLSNNSTINLLVEEIMPIYQKVIHENLELLQQKNHDYDEAWREMRVSSITDIILMKLLRVKQIEDNLGNTLVSEGVEANYQDMLNYSVFALILLDFHLKN